jgi:hypothetical protein
MQTVYRLFSRQSNGNGCIHEKCGKFRIMLSFRGPALTGPASLAAFLLFLVILRLQLPVF